MRRDVQPDRGEMPQRPRAAGGQVMAVQLRWVAEESQQQRTAIRRPIPAGDVAAQAGKPSRRAACCRHHPQVGMAEVASEAKMHAVWRKTRIEVRIARSDRIAHRLPPPAVQAQDRQWRGLVVAL